MSILSAYKFALSVAGVFRGQKRELDLYDLEVHIAASQHIHVILEDYLVLLIAEKSPHFLFLIDIIEDI